MFKIDRINIRKKINDMSFRILLNSVECVRKQLQHDTEYNTDISQGVSRYQNAGNDAFVLCTYFYFILQNENVQ